MNAAAIQAQGNDKLTHRRIMTAPAIAGDELPSTSTEAVALFAAMSYAVIDDVPAGTSGAGNFFCLHSSRIACLGFILCKQLF